MNSLILRVAAPFLLVITLVFSVWVMLKGHNAPGGGFIAGLLAASAFTIYFIAYPEKLRSKITDAHLIFLLSFGLLMVLISGLLAFLIDRSFLAAVWLSQNIGSPLLFDIGVYLIVFSSVALMVLTLQESGE